MEALPLPLVGINANGANGFGAMPKAHPKHGAWQSFDLLRRITRHVSSRSTGATRLPWMPGNAMHLTDIPVYEISTDSKRLDVKAIHAFLSTSYWSPGIPLVSSKPIERRLNP